jgi:alpha-glucosidase (family GH31 glycosyl hydrolase)
MWWLDPSDAETFSIDDQFAVGTDMIVAPVVEKGAILRSVYLPAGSWRRFDESKTFVGGRRVVVDAPLDVLPVFVRAD